MKKWFLGLPVLYQIIIIILVLALCYVAYKTIQGYIRKRKARANYNTTLNQVQTTLNELAQQGVKPSFTQSQYSNWADSLEKAFEGCGTGWQSVGKGVFESLKNDADVHALIQNYGIREIDECGWGTFEGDLAATIGYKFSGYRLCDCIPFWSCNCENCGCVEEINKILESKLIVFRF